ncbi:MAG: hypothetical protein K2X27_27530 [Candidatus Obscuribacterales bacterium]|nr:hypothetical protein [Candidatus Obscuribacterales bacterium]
MSTATGKLISKSLILFFSILPFLAGSSFASAKSGDIPSAAVRVPPMVKEESVSTYVPSEAAPGQGLAVNLIFSAKPRYKDGAPVVVVVPGGNGSQGLDFSMHSAQQGFVEVRFAFPGGGKPGFVSSGIYDYRGIKSQEALRDVLRFAAGEITDSQNKKISELLPFHVDNKSIGAVGWSNGGNTLLVTLGKFASELPFVNWIVFYESPVGNMFFPPSLGGANDMIPNKYYRQGTAATGQVVVDFRKLKYDKNASKFPGSHKKLDEPEIPGLAFFDDNGNGVWEESREFALPYSTDIGVDKQIYPPSVTKALLALPDFQPKVVKIPPGLTALERKRLKGEAPKIPFVSYEESIAYFRERDGSLYIKDLIAQHPTLAFTIFSSHLDHLQRQPDHPHIAMLYNTLLENKPKFVRLNPSSVYVGAVSYMKPSTFRENRPNSSLNADAIDLHLEPEGLVPDYVYMEAAVAELADRVRVGKWNKVLETPLVNYSNGAKPPEEAAPARKSTEMSADDSSSSEQSSQSKSGSVTERSNGKSPADKAGPNPPKNAKPGASSPKDWPFPPK